MSKEYMVVHNRVRARIVSEVVEEKEVEGGVPLEHTEQKIILKTKTGPEATANKRKVGPVVLAISVLVLGSILTSEYLLIRGGKARTPPAPVMVNSIAVLPFMPLNQTSDDEYLQLGIADDLINKLSNLKRIIISPTGAVRRYLDNTQDPTRLRIGTLASRLFSQGDGLS
jgi:hypothetical protein